MLKKLVVAALACLTIFLSRRAMLDPHAQRPTAAEATRNAPVNDVEPGASGRPIRTASNL